MPTGISPLTVGSPTALSTTGGETLTFDIPNDFNIAAFGIRITGAITIGTAAALAVQAGGVANIIKRIRIQAKGDQRLDLLGREWRLLHLIENQGSIEQSDPGLTVAAQSFAITLMRQFQMPRMILGVNDRGILPNNLIRDVQVIIDTDLPQAVLQRQAGTTLAYTGVTVEFFVLQAIPTPLDPNFYLTEQAYALRNTSTLVATGEAQIRINTGGFYRHLLCYAEKSTAGAVDSLISYDDTLVTLLRLFSNRTEIARQVWNSIKADNRTNFVLTSAISGLAVLDFTRTFSPQELLDTDAMIQSGSDLFLAPTVGVAAATSTFGIIGLRLFDNAQRPLIPPAQ